MLTLKGPIATHIGQPLTSGAETFSEKIQGNYSLFGTHISPKELLFLLTAPPELPAEGGGMTTLVDQQTNIDMQSLHLDVVNNVVNRILLDGSESFTYQDQVYITTVLNRLGISDAAQFMTQVRQLRTESESTFHLLELYRAELSRYLERREAGEPVPALPLPAEEGETARREDPRITMCMEVLRRLDTVNLYETVSSFQQNWQTADHRFQRNELRIAEQLRFGGAVSLVENKKLLYEQAPVNLVQHLNQYETGTLLEPPESEEAVLTQAAAAALVSVLDNAATVVLNRPQFWQEQWVHVENALRQTAENSLSRFESYHMQAPPPARTLEESAEAAWSRYAAELRTFQALRWLVNPGAAELPALPPPSIRNGKELFSLTHVLQQMEAEEAEVLQGQGRVERREEIRSSETFREIETLRNLRLEKNAQETLRELQTRETNVSSALPLAYRTESEIFQTRETGWNREQREKEVRQLLESREIRQMWPPRPSVEQIIRQRESRFSSAERLRELRREAETMFRPPQVLRELEPAMPWRPGRTALVPPPPAANMPSLELTPQEAEEQAPGTLLEALQRIDQHNRYMQQAVQQELRKRGEVLPAGPDLRRTMRDALRALEAPESLRLLLPQAEAEERAVPAFTPEEAALLQQASPGDRAIYEAVLLYQKDPEAAVAQGLLRPGNLGVLHAELQQALRAEPAELEHPAEESWRRVEHTETVRELLKQFPAVRQTALPPAEAPLPAVQTVHRQTETAEELLEQMESQRTRRTVETEHREDVTRREVRETGLTQLERKMTARTTEDITELVNRTLSRQMRAITDQVYRQMEKRLQSERSRRGRF